MEPVTPTCTCGHGMHQHCGDGCFVVMSRKSEYEPVFCPCKAAGGTWDPSVQKQP